MAIIFRFINTISILIALPLFGGDRFSSMNVHELEAIARTGDSNAQICMAIRYRNGSDGAQKDIIKARFWAQKSADAGNSKAMLILGQILFWGEDGRVPDKRTALDLYKSSADCGNIDAMMVLYRIYRESKNPASFIYLTKAMNAGDKLALMEMANEYERGEIIPKDDAKAFQFWSETATNGLTQHRALAKYQMAKMYQSGRGIIKNERLAFKLFLEIETMKDEDMYVALDIGECYLFGLGTEPNYKNAFYYLNKFRIFHENHGSNPPAACYFCLGLMAEKGYYVTKNRPMAIKYYQEGILDRRSRMALTRLRAPWFKHGTSKTEIEIIENAISALDG